MPPNSSLGALVGEIIAFPFIVLRSLWRLLMWILRRRAYWQSVALQTKSRFRATAGTFALVLVIGAAADGLIPFDNPLALWSAAGAAGFSLLYIVGGLFGLKCKVDPLSIFWWAVTAVAGCAALLVVFGGVVRW
jgi:hypothetical protein